MVSTATHQAAPASREDREPATPVAPGRSATGAPTALGEAREELVLDALGDAREHTLRLVAHLSEDELTRAHSPIMSPLVWDLAHIAAYEDLWLAHRHAGLELLRPELANVYDAFETPRAVRGEIETLGPREAREYMDLVRARVGEAIARGGVADGTVCEMVVRHELQHTETMRQTMVLAGVLPPGEPPRLGPMTRAIADPADRAGALDAAPHAAWIEVPGGAFQMGAGPDGFAYDNERPRHTVEVPAFQIARRPVTNAEWIAAEDTGASDTGEGGGAVHGHPDEPVCHVSWFDARAYAQAHGARLPSEAEWEKAAGLGLLEEVGQVWEWTSSVFAGYPGFVAHPYREYSEVFFDQDYKVLRGGSWATHPRVKTLTFRNWDLPQRSQIFAGLRLARDVS